MKDEYRHQRFLSVVKLNNTNVKVTLMQSAGPYFFIF